MSTCFIIIVIIVINIVIIILLLLLLLILIISLSLLSLSLSSLLLSLLLLHFRSDDLVAIKPQKIMIARQKSNPGHKRRNRTCSDGIPSSRFLRQFSEPSKSYNSGLPHSSTIPPLSVRDKIPSALSMTSTNISSSLHLPALFPSTAGSQMDICGSDELYRLYEEDLNPNMMALPKEMVLKSDTKLGRFVLKEMRSKYDDNKSSKKLLMMDIIMALMETNIKSN